MIVKASISTEVNLEPKTQRQVFFTLIEQTFNWKSDYFIEDGKVKQKVDNYSSHVFSTIKNVREAAQIDYAVEKVVAQIKKSKN